MVYWNIEGMLKINGRDFYPQIVQILYRSEEDDEDDNFVTYTSSFLEFLENISEN
jgi:hypothetical protein